MSIASPMPTPTAAELRPMLDRARTALGLVQVADAACADVQRSIRIVGDTDAKHVHDRRIELTSHAEAIVDRLAAVDRARVEARRIAPEFVRDLPFRSRFTDTDWFDGFARTFAGAREMAYGERFLSRSERPPGSRGSMRQWLDRKDPVRSVFVRHNDGTWTRPEPGTPPEVQARMFYHELVSTIDPWKSSRTLAPIVEGLEQVVAGARVVRGMAPVHGAQGFENGYVGRALESIVSDHAMAMRAGRGDAIEPPMRIDTRFAALGAAYVHGAYDIVTNSTPAMREVERRVSAARANTTALA